MIEVAAGVIVRAGSVLACQRSAAGRHPLKFEFPGGKREAGESIEECLRRELEEELGIQAEIGACLWRTRHCYPGREPFELHFFAVSSYSGELDNRIFESLRWQPRERLAELDFLEADLDFVAQLAAGNIALP